MTHKPFFAINVPVSGALGIFYRIMNGGSYALFVETPSAVKMEIGLNTINGVVDVLDSVCVTYADGVTAFASAPADIVKVKQYGATHYRRKHSAGESDWWPIDAAFGFGVPDAQLTTVCIARDGVVGVTQLAGPFPKTAPVTTTTTAAATTTTTTTTTPTFACPSGWSPDSVNQRGCIQDGSTGCPPPKPLLCPTISGYSAMFPDATCFSFVSGQFWDCIYVL